MIRPAGTQDVIDFYHHRYITPVVIYPEIFDNPLNVSFFGRHILNYPGKAALGRYSDVEDFAIAYSRILAQDCTNLYPAESRRRRRSLYSTMDLGFWKTGGQAAIRRGTCFYAGKMRRVHGTAPENVPDGSSSCTIPSA